MPEKVRATYLKFIKELMKVYDKRDKVEESALKLLKAVNANNILIVKKLVGQKEFSVPRVAIRSIYGYQDEERILINVEGSS